MSPHSRFRRLTLAGLMLAVVVGTTIPAARADHIDDKLIEAAPDLVKTLQDKGFKNVGVLKFMVKKGKSPTDGSSGPLNMNMAERVENALLLGLDEAKPLGVIHDATQVAAKADPKYSIRSVEARKALFTHKYPLAWGTEKVAPDAFVTGTVDLSVDMKQTAVDIGYFDKTGVIHPLKTLEVKTDRSILADSGQSFAIAKRGLKSRDLSELDNSAADSAAQADKGTTVAQQLAKDNDSAPIKFEIRYGDAPQEIKADASSSGEMSVATPKKGDLVTFMLTNTSKDKIGVVVKVNGVSTLENETSEDPACLKWVLEAGKTYGLRGFYSQGKVDLFKVLDDDESAARMSDWGGSKPRAGYIDVSVFRENPDGEEMKAGRTLRNATSRGPLQRPATAKDAKARILKQSAATVPPKTKTRGLIVEGGGTEDKVLEKDALKNPTQVYQMQIGYYKPGAATPTP